MNFTSKGTCCNMCCGGVCHITVITLLPPGGFRWTHSVSHLCRSDFTRNHMRNYIITTDIKQKGDLWMAGLNAAQSNIWLYQCHDCVRPQHVQFQEKYWKPAAGPLPLHHTPPPSHPWGNQHAVYNTSCNWRSHFRGEEGFWEEEGDFNNWEDCDWTNPVKHEGCPGFTYDLIWAPEKCSAIAGYG